MARALAPEDPTVAPAPEPPPAAEASDSPEQARERHIERVKKTGPDRRNLAADARRVGENWSEVARAEGLDVTFDSWECYQGGCLVSALHGSPQTLDRATEALAHSAGFMSWNGEKLRTGPVEASPGKPEATWILFAPPAGEPALTAELEAPSTPAQAPTPQ